MRAWTHDGHSARCELRELDGRLVLSPRGAAPALELVTSERRLVEIVGYMEVDDERLVEALAVLDRWRRRQSDLGAAAEDAPAAATTNGERMDAALQHVRAALAEVEKIKRARGADYQLANVLQPVVDRLREVAAHH